MISMTGKATAALAQRALLLAALALALATAGCGTVGCFAGTEAEGSCPSQDEAIAFFGDPSCGGQVDSVDSEPEFDGDYCCYDITKVNNDDLYYCDGL